MSAKIKILRADYTPQDLKELAAKCKDRRQKPRLRALAMVLEDKMPRREIARKAGVDTQTVRDWVLRFNEHGPEGLSDRPRSGRPPRLDGDQIETVREWLTNGPDPEAGEPVRWCLADIVDKIRTRFNVSYSVEGVRQLIRRLGFRYLSPRPIHPRAKPDDQRAFRNDFSELARKVLPETVTADQVHVWFQDEARIGQKGMLSRFWALKGTRPRILRDHRFQYCYLFSAACPDTGRAIGHVCDRANTDEMNRHLQDISAVIAEGDHALIVLDGAGWHRSKALVVPDNITLLRLPPYSPELNPMETVFSLLKHKYFANRVFETADHVKSVVTEVWNGFAAVPDGITRITRRKWAVV